MTSVTVVHVPMPTNIEALTCDEARLLTDRIKTAAIDLYALLLEAHQRKAWLALGYPSWRDYATSEFNISQAHAYRLLNQAVVVTALEEAADSPIGEIPEHLTRSIKHRLPELTAEIRERRAKGQAPVEAVEAAIAAAKKRSLAPKTVGSNKTITNVVEGIAGLLDGIENTVNFSALDPSRIADWVEGLRQAGHDIARLCERLEQEEVRR